MRPRPETRSGARGRERRDTEQSSPDERAREIEEQMTDDERFSLICSLMPVVYPTPHREPRVPSYVPPSVGWVPGVPRLGVPPLLITDGALGVSNPGGRMRPGDPATALPAGLALGATFDLPLARHAGAVIGREARAKGFNVLTGGAMNLPRDPRHGRNFEYFSEDPWHAGVMAAEHVIGTQSEGVISMVKHVSLDVHETNKFVLDAVIDPDAHRESDLLAFQIAIERAEPGAVMAAHNMVNGAYCCGNHVLLNEIVKDAFGFKGWVMSSWKAVHHWDFALHGLDQQLAAQLDEREWFGEPLRAAFVAGKLSRERLSDMVRRILRSIYAVGADRWGAPPAIDPVVGDACALEIARHGIVVLDNDGVLPLVAGSPAVQRIAVIGGHADVAVLTGGGTSQCMPRGGYTAVMPLGGGDSPLAPLRREAYFPTSPVAELRKLLPASHVAYNPGIYPDEAAMIARHFDVAIVFVVKFESEGYDSPDLSLPLGQDALIEAVAAANPNTIVVLETGNPVAMPWRHKVRAIVEAWYPGQAGGRAIAEILTGVVNPSGRLPITFPQYIAQTPRPALLGFGDPFGTPLTVEYTEGAELGYRWFARTGAVPMFPFGHGLSYTQFAYRNLELAGGDTITARFTVTNIGDRDGADVPQLYLVEAAGERRMRLLGFERVQLRAGELRRITLTVEPRLLARFDGEVGGWRIGEGDYRVALGKSAGDLVLEARTTLRGRTFGR